MELQLPKETFPTDEEIKQLDELHLNPEHGYFEASHGSKLHFQKWFPRTTTATADNNNIQPKGIAVFQHGIQAHGGLSCALNGEVYGVTCMVKAVTEAGYILYCLDMVGHGFSEGERFFIPNSDWKVNRDDLSAFAHYVSKDDNSDLPLFLVGQSYGSCLSIHIARQWMDTPDEAPSNFKGICILAPAIIADLPPQPVVDLLTILAHLFPAWTPFFMPNPISPDRIWDNAEVAKEFNTARRKEMRLSGGGEKLRLGTALGVVNALEKVREAIPGLTVPFYVAHGTNDFGVPIAGTEFLLEHAATPKEDRCINFVVGAYHNLLSSKYRQEILDSMIKWMDSRM